ncbi:Uncharacterised protein [Enterobacter cloacae]|nr:Uncharacterised protein [Enterobacter cloacae]
MGEVDHADNAVNHRVADGDQRVGASQRDAVKHLLQKVEKLLGHMQTFLYPPGKPGGGIIIWRPRTNRRRAT